MNVGNLAVVKNSPAFSGPHHSDPKTPVQHRTHRLVKAIEQSRHHRRINNKSMQKPQVPTTWGGGDVGDHPQQSKMKVSTTPVGGGCIWRCEQVGQKYLLEEYFLRL